MKIDGILTSRERERELNGDVAEANEQLSSTPDNPKSFIEWSDQEVEMFVDAFSIDNFELVKPKQGEKKGFVKVTIPDTVEPMAKGLIKAEWQIVEAFDAPLEKESQERISRFIGNTTNAVNASEVQEAEWIQTFGQFFQAVGEMKGKPDPELEKTKSGVRKEAHRVVTSFLKILLMLASDFSWDSFIQKQREKYGTPENVPKDIEEAILAKYEDYQQVKGLIDGDPKLDQVPRFMIVNSTGREIFRSIPELNAS